MNPPRKRRPTKIDAVAIYTRNDKGDLDPTEWARLQVPTDWIRVYIREDGGADVELSVFALCALTSDMPTRDRLKETAMLLRCPFKVIDPETLR